jgi:putative transposase
VAKKGHTEEQILRALRQAEGGSRVADICREHGISEATFYIYGRLPRSKKVGFWSGGNRLQTSIRRHHSTLTQRRGTARHWSARPRLPVRSYWRPRPSRGYNRAAGEDR